MRRLALSLALCAAPVWGAGAEDFVTLKGHGGPIMALAVDDDDRVASASFDNTAAIWQEGSPTWLEAHDAATTAVTFGPRGALFSGGDDFAIYRWQQGQPQEIGRHAGKIRALDVSLDGAFLASASWDGTIGLWSLNGGTGQQITVGAGVNDVRFDAKGRLFAATMAGQVQVYDTPDATPRLLAEQGFGINRLVLSQEGWLAYGAVDGGTRVIDMETGAQIADFTLDRRPILALAYYAQSQQIAVGDGHGYIMMIDTRNWTIARDFRAMREGPVWALAFSRDGSRIWAGGIHDVIYGWPIALMDSHQAAGNETRSFLQAPETMSNGERQFMRKCSICHDLNDAGQRRAGPHLAGLFGRAAGSLPGYRYSQTLLQSDLIWTDETIDALFDQGPDHYIPGSKMPMQRITAPTDRQDLIDYLKTATKLPEDD
ncbi:c-type cytochrome [Tritonibacter mobilis]|uniref:c-type cytochrome n=1 Tax=Tritonibacter mobilis TaxID=379347 RepID=UPI001C09A3C7|nr:c-type cytochrome [Tritonibacter mobilis]MBU3036102.1 c-type cytochrome [Tritonibacter mobilis]WHQ82861.1 c-type cytochrome [Tritonibacter mobilis]